MKSRARKMLVAASAVAAVATAGAMAGTVATGATDDRTPGPQSREGASIREFLEREQPVNATVARRARAAAVAAAGGGTAGDVDTDREGGATYEVEVTRDSGPEVEVLLDSGFDVVGVDRERDSGEARDDEGPDDDSPDDEAEDD